MPVTRRTLLGMLSGSTFFLTAGRRVAAMPAEPRGAASFPQGVASGDPRPDAVMLWTRGVPEDGASELSLQLQVSEDAEFESLVLHSRVNALEQNDYTLRAYINGLKPDRIYYYRFLAGGDTASRVGRTRTAPADDAPREVRLAFASCQSYEQGYYGAWARMLADDEASPEDQKIDFVLHLGDFIYERSWPTRSDGSPMSRTLPDFPDGARSGGKRHAVSLADYRHLYKTYLSDPHLQEARARWPFICTWDDHEFSNDNFQSFSTYSAEARAEPARKMQSNQAWFEYIPAVLDQLTGQPAHDFRAGDLSGNEQQQNASALHSLVIYRRLRWGRHADLLLTDNRSYRSPPCLPEGFAEAMGLVMNPVQLVEIADAGREYNDGQPPEFLPFSDGTIVNPARERPHGTILGDDQRQWFLQALESSSATWKLWGNSLPLIAMRLDLASLPFAGLHDSIFSIDPWAGYPYEQRLIMEHLEKRGISGLVSLSGDHHMHGAGTVCRDASEPDARPVAVDFNVAGISSTPLFDDLKVVARDAHPDFQALAYGQFDGETIPVWNMSMLDGALSAYSYSKIGLKSLARWLGPNRANPGLNYVDTTANGYGLARLDGVKMQVQLVTVAKTPGPFEQPPAVEYRAHFSLPAWQSGTEPQLSPPHFEGGAPFPFAPEAV